MATLREIARYYADEIRDGIAWVIVWKEGRGWHGLAVWLNTNDDKFEPDDEARAREILELDPAAIMINGYYCGHLGEDMTIDELADGIRWHYENGANRIDGSTALRPRLRDELTDEELETVLETCAAAGDRLREAFAEFGRQLCEAFRPVIQAIIDTIKKTADAVAEIWPSYEDVLIRSVATPRQYHLYKHGRPRVRKKWKNQLLHKAIREMR